MVNAQEWMDRNYPNKEEKKKVEWLSISKENLEGELDLSEFGNLEGLECYNNSLTNLKVNDCDKLRKIICYDNQLTNLDLSNLNQLKELSCYSNYLEKIIYPTNPEKLTRLDIRNNNLSEQNLSIFGQFKSLERLKIGNADWKENNKISQGIYNRFTGSLEFLRSLSKLNDLDIANTDLNNGVEYLSESLGYIHYETKDRSDCKLVEIKEQLNRFYWRDIHKDFILLLKKAWIKRGFNREECGKLINAGFKPDNYPEARRWKNKKFTVDQVWEWIKAGVKLEDYEFVSWLRDVKKETHQWVLDYKEDYEALSDRFKRYGLCSECNQPNTGEKWCQSCNSKRFKENFTNWTSSKLEIDQFIQKYHLEATGADKFLEWIPYQQFTDVEFLAEGGFGKVYKAKWTEGNISYWDINNKQWNREKDYYYEEEDKNKKNRQEIQRLENITNRTIQQEEELTNKKKELQDFERNEKNYRKYRNYKTVVLKSLSNFSENANFLRETANHKIIDDWFNNIVPCYGISQNPQTGNYLMVMKYVEGGDLRKYLTSNKLTFNDKLKRLINIIQGLKDVHQKNLVHRDFHSGNILNSDIQSFITDLGLCKPVNEVNQEKEIYGVLPYVAPEVLSKKGYTLASDIYSLGMVAYEIFSNASPYLDREYDTSLAVEICQGLRPNLDMIKIPQLLKDLIKRCWNSELTKRPTALQLERTLREWQKDAEFVNQLQLIEKEYNQISQNTSYKFHPTSVMTSKRIDTKLITQLLKQKTIKLHGTQDLELNLDMVEEQLEDLVLQEDSQEQPQTHQETPPKK